MTRPGKHTWSPAWWARPLLLGLLCVTAPHHLRGQEQGAASPDVGKQLFETVCVACHTIGGGVRIGPDLQGVTGRRERAWLLRFISDPERMRSEGDSIAAANLARFGVRMPNLGLTAPQVEAVIAHLGAAEPVTAVRPPLFLPTLALAVLAAAGITLIALTAGTKRVETRA